MKQGHKVLGAWVLAAWVLAAWASAVVVACDERARQGEESGSPDTSSAAEATADTMSDAGERPTCSAAGLEPDESDPPDLPQRVSEMRRAILRAAVACDYERLEALAFEGGTMFAHSFGGDSTPAAYWRDLEEGGEEPMGMLVRTLALPYAREGDVYVWPSAASEQATGFDWMALEGLYSDEEIASFINYGSFMGWRVGITEEGDWRFFVAGD
jgi:hypothetical protein